MTTPSKRRRMQLSRGCGRGATNRLVYERQGMKCCYCQCDLIIPMRNHDFNILVNKRYGNLATREHLQRLADGGKNHPDNIAIACSRCNSGRGNTNWLEYCTTIRGETVC